MRTVAKTTPANVRLRIGRWFWLILTVNLGGILYGFVYYLPQFQATPWYLWPLVPDSPMAVLLLTIPLVMLRTSRAPPPWLTLLGAASMIQVGLWTAIVLPMYAGHFGFDITTYRVTLEPNGLPGGVGLNSWLWWLHLAMAAEAWLVLDRLPLGRVPYALVGAGMLAHTLLDHALPISYPWRTCTGMFPHTLPCDLRASLILMTLGLTLVSIGGLYALRRRNQSEPASSRR